MLTAFAAADLAEQPSDTAGIRKARQGASNKEAFGDDLSTCADPGSPALSFTSDLDDVSSVSLEDQDPEHQESSDVVRDLALELAAQLEPLAEDRRRAAVAWAGCPVGVRVPLGAEYPSLFQPLEAAENARLLAVIVAAARAPGCVGLAKAVSDARKGLTSGGACLLTLERVCRAVHEAAVVELGEAKLRRARLLEDGRMRQDRGRAPLGCSRPADIGLGVAAMRLSAWGQVVADEHAHALEEFREQVLALHAAVQALVGFLQAVACP